MPLGTNGQKLPPTMLVERSFGSLSKGAIEAGVSMNSLGLLFTPRVLTGLDDLTVDTRFALAPWAADCDGFNGFKEEPYLRMIERLTYRPGCRFITVPDVFTGTPGDAQATLDQFEAWLPVLQGVWADVNETSHQPLALVLQNGVENLEIPWGEIDAVFVGGTTDYKLSNAVADLVAEAKDRGLWVHVGRVNSAKRIAHVIEIGADSFDGTGVVKYMNAVLPRLAAAQQKPARGFQPRIDELDQVGSAEPVRSFSQHKATTASEGLTLS